MLLKKLKNLINNQSSGNDNSDLIFIPNLDDNNASNSIPKSLIYQSRFNRGVNFGSMFILEKWIYHSLYPANCPSDCELDCMKSCSNIEDVANKLTDHYKIFIDDDAQWEWLSKKAGVNGIRVPIGYWHIKNGDIVAESSISDSLLFKQVIKVYQMAKPYDYLRKLIEKCDKYNIGVLIDLHGLPGSVNGQSHSGEIISPPKFFEQEIYSNFIIKEIIPFLVNDLQDFENIIGLQVINEASFADKNSNLENREMSYYLDCLKAVRGLDCSWPIIISDGWWPEQWSDWVNRVGLATEIVIDSHCYRCFSENDKNKTVPQIIDELPQTFNLPDTADFVVGEFSCVLDGATWEKTSVSGTDREELVKQFGNKQIEIFNERAHFGWFFWTFKFELGDGGEWGFVPMIEKECIPGAKMSCEEFNIDDNRINQIIAEHVNYWKNNCGGDDSKFEHWRFEDGLKQACADIYDFARFNNSRIGRVKFWKNFRRQNYLRMKNDSEYMWEWDQGYERGLNEFNRY